MKRSSLTILFVLAIGCGLLIAGCAKEGVMQKAEEIKPPQMVSEPVPSFTAESSKVETAVSVPILTSEIKAFENKDIHFDFDNFTLKPEDIEILNEKASFLKVHPDLKIRIEGNCDERGTIEYNIALGERRAKAAKNYLVKVGIDKEKISTLSYGKEKPLDPAHNEEAWAKNRRGHFIVLDR